MFSTAANNQPAVDIHILQGERSMAADNKTLGNFQLSGIAPAPRGVPQIEVTFDIDANGIVNVKAKDLGTNKEQAITVTASSNLSEEEIERMMKEAEENKADDERRKDEADTKNDAEQLIFQTEKTLEDLGDKVEDKEKEDIEESIKDLKEELEKADTEDIKKAIEKLQEKAMKLGERIYQNAAENENAEETTTEEDENKDSDVKEAEFEEN